MAIIPAEPSTVFRAWAKCLGELIFWATNPDAGSTSRDGWREHFRDDIRDKGDRARDASPDDVTRNQVSRSRSLAAGLIRLLNSCPELNSTSCRNWSQVDRLVVEQLAELQAVFAKLGDGKLQAHIGVKPPLATTKARKNLDWIATSPPSDDGEWWMQPLVRGTVNEFLTATNTKNPRALKSRHRKSLLLVARADGQVACYFRSPTELKAASERTAIPTETVTESKTVENGSERREIKKSARAHR